jgi:tetratricopeptide (TPR) repeat protein
VLGDTEVSSRITLSKCAKPQASHAVRRPPSRWLMIPESPRASRSLTRLAAAVVVAAVAGCAAAGAQAAPGPYQRALALERQGKVRAALALLERHKLSAEEAAHRARLQSLVEALAANAVFARVGEYGLAKAVLDRAEKQLRPVTELPLLMLVYRREARLAREVHRPANTEAAAVIAKADALSKDHKHRDAAEVYKAVAQQPAGIVLQRLRSRARVGELREQAAAATQHGSRLAGLWHVLATALTWILYVVLVAVLAAALYGVHRLLGLLPPRRGTALTVEDLDADSSERSTKSYVLAQQLQAEIRGAGASGTADVGVDESRDLDGSTASAPAPRVADASLQRFVALIQADTPLKIGPFSLNPRQIVFLVAPFLRRSEAELSGGLVSDGTRVSLTIERFEAGQREAAKAWQVVCDGDGAHAHALAQMAARIVSSSGVSTISADWQSLIAYRSAMTKLNGVGDAADKRQALEGVRAQLRRAVDHDPGNILARFRLARIERQLGENETAAEHFAFIDALARRAADFNPTGFLGAFFSAHPEMGYVARYNRAVSLAKIDDRRCHNDAIDLLLALGMELSGEETLEPRERRRLQMLTASAWADALAYELMKLSERDQQPGGPGSDIRLAKRKEKVESLIREIRDWLDSMDATQGAREDRAWIHSYATAQNAYGRALAIQGETNEAIAAFQSAIALTPDLADAYVNLGEALRQKKPREWLRRTELTLQRAVELAPDNDRALLLLGLLLADPAVGKVDEAREVLKRVKDDPWAPFRIAELDADEQKFPDAARCAMQSVRISKTPDIRSVKLVEWTLRVGKSVERVVLDAAIAAARDLSRLGTARQQARAARDLQQLQLLR